MLKPEEINEQNVDQAIDEMVAEVKSLITTTRRTEEMSAALAQVTGEDMDHAARARAHLALLHLETALSDLLLDRAHGDTGKESDE